MKQLDKNILLNGTKEFRIEQFKSIKSWLNYVSKQEGKTIDQLEYTLLKDEELLTINIETLNHDDYTDIITFDLGVDERIITGDIYVSYERVRDNAKVFHVKQMDEMRRVLLHGLLHLIGYKDKSAVDKNKMREKEDYYLNKYNTYFHNKDK